MAKRLFSLLTLLALLVPALTLAGMPSTPKQPAEDIQRLDRGVLRQIDTISFGWQLSSASVTIRPPDLLQTDVIDHIRAIYAQGQRMRNRGDVFAKIGDSITVNDNFLHPIGYGVYDLGEYGYLYDVIEHFDARALYNRSSFNRVSVAAGVGWSAWAALNPEYATPDLCDPEERPLDCEYRLIRPSLALIMFGTNEVSYMDTSIYIGHISRIIDLSEERGVIPIISTLPDRHAWEDKIARWNDQLRDLAAERQIPLWDYAAALRDLPAHGLGHDGVHPSFPPDGWFERAALFDPEHLQYGYNVRNLTALQILDRVWRAVDVPPPTPTPIPPVLATLHPTATASGETGQP
jgi:hypothetical protein